MRGSFRSLASNAQKDEDQFMVAENGQEGNVMAYQKPVDMLASGNTFWNRWRQAYADVQEAEPDLHGADLHQRNFRGIDFHEADLTEANLREADLRHADLRQANLSETLLQHACLRGADLREAKLCRANLQGADLSHADFRGAELSGADLHKALLDQAQFEEAKESREESNEPLKAKVPGPASTALHDAAAA